MKIVCTSINGDSLTVQYAFPFYYVSCEGLMTYTSDVVTAEPYIPGEVYQGSHNPKRNLLLTFAVKHNQYWELRETIYRVFGDAGRFEWFPDVGPQRNIDYYVESIELSEPNTMGFRQCTVSLICPFPFFSGLEETTQLAYWKKMIILPFVMHSPFVVGKRMALQNKIITNLQPINVGIVVSFTATGESVTNPSLENITTGESFKLAAFLSPGQTAVVNTNNGKKIAFYADDPQDFDLWDYERNDWIQLHPGDNVFRYNADSGLDYLDVSIRYSQLYLGG